MASSLRFHSAIPSDLLSALKYYDAISPELGDRFRETVDRRLEEIAENPKGFAIDVSQRLIDFPI